MTETNKNGKNSVLIVDDSQFNITSLSSILSSKYIIYIAKDGREAIETAKRFLPDVILLDIMMHGMDGFEVIAALKINAATREIPVIFITGLDSSENEEKGLSLNAADYITKPFNPAVVELRVRNQMRIVNQIRTIKRLLMFDPLTEIPNRHSFNDRLSVEWGRALREKTPIGILMMDLDKFKLYNDTYGHMQGDILLQHAAKTFEQSVKRTTDFIARWGGEEFAALLPNTCKEGILKVAEEIRANIERMTVLTSGGALTGTTISIGANCIVPEPDSSTDVFITQADIALYSAKNQGRNRVCFYSL